MKKIIPKSPRVQTIPPNLNNSQILQKKITSTSPLTVRNQSEVRDSTKLFNSINSNEDKSKKDPKLRNRSEEKLITQNKIKTSSSTLTVRNQSEGRNSAKLFNSLNSNEDKSKKDLNLSNKSNDTQNSGNRQILSSPGIKVRNQSVGNNSAKLFNRKISNEVKSKNDLKIPNKSEVNHNLDNKKITSPSSITVTDKSEGKDSSMLLNSSFLNEEGSRKVVKIPNKSEVNQNSDNKNITSTSSITVRDKSEDKDSSKLLNSSFLNEDGSKKDVKIPNKSEEIQNSDNTRKELKSVTFKTVNKTPDLTRTPKKRIKIFDAFNPKLDKDIEELKRMMDNPGNITPSVLKRKILEKKWEILTNIENKPTDNSNVSDDKNIKNLQPQREGSLVRQKKYESILTKRSTVERMEKTFMKQLLKLAEKNLVVDTLEEEKIEMAIRIQRCFRSYKWRYTLFKALFLSYIRKIQTNWRIYKFRRNRNSFGSLQVIDNDNFQYIPGMFGIKQYVKNMDTYNLTMIKKKSEEKLKILNAQMSSFSSSDFVGFDKYTSRYSISIMSGESDYDLGKPKIALDAWRMTKNIVSFLEMDIGKPKILLDTWRMTKKIISYQGMQNGFDIKQFIKNLDTNKLNLMNKKSEDQISICDSAISSNSYSEFVGFDQQSSHYSISFASDENVSDLLKLKIPLKPWRMTKEIVSYVDLQTIIFIQKIYKGILTKRNGERLLRQERNKPFLKIPLKNRLQLFLISFETKVIGKHKWKYYKILMENSNKNKKLFNTLNSKEIYFPKREIIGSKRSNNLKNSKTSEINLKKEVISLSPAGLAEFQKLCLKLYQKFSRKFFKSIKEMFSVDVFSTMVKYKLLAVLDNLILRKLTEKSFNKLYFNGLEIFDKDKKENSKKIVNNLGNSKRNKTIIKEVRIEDFRLCTRPFSESKIPIDIDLQTNSSTLIESKKGSPPKYNTANFRANCNNLIPRNEFLSFSFEHK